jgi:ribosomal protein L11 methyltransferase
LVAANILAPVIIRLLQDGLGDLLSPGGRLILAGILLSQEADVEEACTNAGLTVVMRRQMGDWAALCVSR